MKLRIEIATNNEAFDSGKSGKEIGRILRDYAATVEEYGVPLECTLTDINGQKVGQVTIHEVMDV